MSAHGHLNPTQIRSRLSHPVVERRRPLAGVRAGLQPDMMEVSPEAYELIEDGLITTDDFRDFTFSNAVRLWGTQNPKFFEGTAVAKTAADRAGGDAGPRVA
jgi:hypothetical protein